LEALDFDANLDALANEPLVKRILLLLCSDVHFVLGIIL